jgi:hypothetical protein
MTTMVDETIGPELAGPRCLPHLADLPLPPSTPRGRKGGDARKNFCSFFRIHVQGDVCTHGSDFRWKIPNLPGILRNATLQTHGVTWIKVNEKPRSAISSEIISTTSECPPFFIWPQPQIMFHPHPTTQAKQEWKRKTTMWTALQPSRSRLCCPSAVLDTTSDPTTTTTVHI